MSTDDNDQRDERTRELLGVEQLDDVTRRRLVRTALEATATADAPRRDRTPRWLVPAAAAAVVILAVGGVLVLVNSGRDDTRGSADSSASEAPAEDASPVPTTEQEELSRDRAEGGAATAPQAATPVPLGDLGTAPSPEALAARAERVYARGSTSPTVEAAASCVDQFEPALAVTTGTVDGAPTTVLVYDDRVLVVDSTTCAVATEVAR